MSIADLEKVTLELLFFTYLKNCTEETTDMQKDGHIKKL